MSKFFVIEMKLTSNDADDMITRALIEADDMPLAVEKAMAFVERLNQRVEAIFEVEMLQVSLTFDEIIR